MSQQLADDPNTSCVEHGTWTAVPVAPPANLEQFTLRLGDVDAAEDERIAKSGVMTFHAVGCSGDYSDHTPQMAVAAGMAAQAKDAGSAGRPGSPAVPASFFYHLGDVVYMDADKRNPARNEQSQLYNDQFYTPYTEYGRSIFAIAGNHDGKMHATTEHAGEPEHSAIAHFLLNFCAARREPSPDNRVDGRSTLTQPYVYWRLSTPLAEFIGLYANIANGGMLDDPAQSAQPQYRWLVAQLSDIRRRSAQDNPRKAVLVTVHYPPYSGVYNFQERGDPTLAQTAGAENAVPLGALLQRAFAESGQRPDAVLSAHTHLYQRLTFRCADGWEIPYLVAGSGGHAPVSSIRHQCDDSLGPARGVPFDAVLPRAEALASGEQQAPRLLHSRADDDALGKSGRGSRPSAGERAQVVAYNDQAFGFLRLTVAGRTLTSEFFTAGQFTPPTLFDSFALDMGSHRISV